MWPQFSMRWAGNMFTISSLVYRRSVKHMHASIQTANSSAINFIILIKMLRRRHGTNYGSETGSMKTTFAFFSTFSKQTNLFLLTHSILIACKFVALSTHATVIYVHCFAIMLQVYAWMRNADIKCVLFIIYFIFAAD